MLGIDTVGSIVRAVRPMRKSAHPTPAPTHLERQVEPGDMLHLSTESGRVVEVVLVAFSPVNTVFVDDEAVTLYHPQSGNTVTLRVQRVLPRIVGYRYAEVA